MDPKFQTCTSCSSCFPSQFKLVKIKSFGVKIPKLSPKIMRFVIVKKTEIAQKLLQIPIWVYCHYQKFYTVSPPYRVSLSLLPRVYLFLFSSSILSITLTTFHTTYGLTWLHRFFFFFSLNTQASDHCLGPEQHPRTKLAYQAVALVRLPGFTLSLSLSLQTSKGWN
jgi:hypothetical protein